MTTPESLSSVSGVTEEDVELVRSNQRYHRKMCERFDSAEHRAATDAWSRILAAVERDRASRGILSEAQRRRVECIRRDIADGFVAAGSPSVFLLAIIDRLTSGAERGGSDETPNMEHLTCFLVALPPLPVVPEVDYIADRAKFAVNWWSAVSGKTENLTVEIHADGHVVYAGPAGSGSATCVTDAIAALAPQFAALFSRSSGEEARDAAITKNRDAWKDFALHAAHCVECCQMHYTDCDEGKALYDAAEAGELPSTDARDEETGND